MRSFALIKSTESLCAPTGFIDAMKSNYAFVARNAQHISVNYDILESYASSLPKLTSEEVLDADHHYVTDNDEANLAYVMALDSMNFGSGFQDKLRAEGFDMSAGFYFSVARALKEHFEQNRPMSAAEMAQLKAQDIADIIKLPNIDENPYSFRVALSYRSSINELGEYICRAHGGAFMNMVRASHGKAENFIYMLSRLGSYNDMSLYRGQRIAFFKRAISCAADLNDMWQHSKRELFSDINHLPCLADCDIPHVLRVDDILHYSEELTEIIDNQELIEAGCMYEVELRACAVHALEIMAARSGRSAMELDRILWHRAQEDAYKEKAPHRCETKFY